MSVTDSDRYMMSSVEGAWNTGNLYYKVAQNIINDSQYFEKHKNVFDNLKDGKVVNTKEDALKVIKGQYGIQCAVIGIGLLQLTANFESFKNEEVGEFLEKYGDAYELFSDNKKIFDQSPQEIEFP